MRKSSGKQKYKASFSFFWVLLIALFVTIALEIGIAIGYLSKGDWKEVLISVTKDVIAAVIVTFLAGTFVKMLTDRYFIVKKNDKLLKDFGVANVGTGKSTAKDVMDIFGNPAFHIYPKEIHFIFITRRGYLETFQDNLMACLEHGCNVKILLASYAEHNLRYVHRLESLYNKNSDKNDDDKDSCYVKELKEVETMIDNIRNKLAAAGPSAGKIELRFYNDEYFYNFRSAKYYDSKKETFVHKNFINVQSFNAEAVDCSIGLSGTFIDTDDNQKNIFYQNDKTFERLWEEFEGTDYKGKSAEGTSC